MSAIDTIVREVARMRDVTVAELLSAGRQKGHVRPRQEAMYLTKRLTLRSVSEIGRRLRRDHTTVLHSIHEVETRIGEIVGYGDELEVMESQIRRKLVERAFLKITSAEAIDAVAVAQEIRDAEVERRPVEVSADEVRALAAHVLQTAAAAKELCPDATPAERPVLIVRPNKAIVDAARRVGRASERYDQAKFSPGERFALSALEEALKGLRTELQASKETIQ